MPCAQETQRVAARRAVQLLAEYKRTGRMQNLMTETLRSETWQAVAAQWQRLFRS